MIVCVFAANIEFFICKNGSASRQSLASVPGDRILDGGLCCLAVVPRDSKDDKEVSYVLHSEEHPGQLRPRCLSCASPEVTTLVQHDHQPNRYLTLCSNLMGGGVVRDKPEGLPIVEGESAPPLQPRPSEKGMSQQESLTEDELAHQQLTTDT